VSVRRHIVEAGRRTPSVSLLLGAVAVATCFAPAAVSHALEYERSALAGGQLWRVLTCHWTHITPDHLLWSGMVFVVLGSLCERLVGRGRFAVCMLASALAIPAALWIVQPDMQSYRGLSGVDSAFFGLLAVTLIRQSLAKGRRIHAMVIGGWVAAFMLKTGIEYGTGAAIFVDSAAGAFDPVPLAHVVGALVGVAVGLIRAGQPRLERMRRPNQGPEAESQRSVAIPGFSSPKAV
jgi:rhomboid family GlyGly-CTERM serine protease